MRRLRFLLFLLLPFLHLAAQDPYAQVINSGSGLPGNAVYDLLQDSKGFMWFATDDGITRYDGHSFKKFYSPEQTSKPGSQLHEDRYGRMWYENFDGFLYYVEHDTLKKLGGTNPIGYVNFAILNDRLLTFERDGIQVFDLKTLAALKKVQVPGMNYFITANQSPEMYYVVTDQLLMINREGTIKQIPFQTSSAEIRQLSIVNTGEEKIYITLHKTARSEFYVYSENQLRPQFTFPYHGYVQGTFYTDSCFWYCTSSGVYGYHADGTPRNGGEPYFGDKSISGVLKDREGGFWFTTTNEGVLYVPDISRKLVQTRFSPYRLLLLGDSLFIGSRKDEVYCYAPAAGSMRLLRQGPIHNEINYLFGDTGRNALYYNSGYNLVAVNYSGGKLLDENFAVKNVCRVDEKYLAFAATGSCCLFATDTSLASAWDRWPVSTDKTIRKQDIVHGVRGKAVCFNRNSGLLYFATNIGLFAATPTEKQELRRNGKSLYLLGLQFFNNLVYGFDAQGLLYEISGHTVKLVSGRFLPSPGPVRFLKVTGDYFFVRTDEELYYANAKQNPGTLRKMEISMQSLDITDLELWQHKLILATDKGLLLYDFGTGVKNTVQPAFVLNSMQVNNVPAEVLRGQAFDYENNNVEISYSILSFKTGSQYPLYYKINDAEWALAAPESRTLKLVSLSPGDYRIRFRLGLHEFPEQELVFTINKPWWLRLWFLLLCLLLFVAAGYLYFRWRIGVVKKQNKLIQEKMELEKNLNKSMLASIKAQMNPHFFYNALNTIQAFIFSDDKKNASSYLARFSKLTRMILEFSEKEHITLSEEISALKLYLEIEQARFNDDFEFHIRIGPEVNTESIRIPSMLIQPYVENAVKHGLLHKKEHKILILSFSCSGQVLRVSIDDNGIGRKRSEELNRIRKNKHEAFATNANQTRLNILNNDKQLLTAVDYIDKTDNHNNPAGTTVIITVPVK